MEELKKALESITPTLNKKELDARFPEIAKLLMKNYGIRSKGKTYLLNEIEFYYYDEAYDDKRSENSKRHITYERTAQAGCWFIHDYGVDLTFKSSKEEGYGGGILIRAIEEEDTPEAYTIGPVKCLEEIWEEAVNAFSPTAPNPTIVKIAERNIDFSDATTRITVDKVDRWQSLWRFTVKGAHVSKL